MKIHKSLLHLLVFFLGFSYVIASISELPTSRSLKSIKENPALQDLQAQEIGGGEMLAVEGLVEGRMDLESTDYPGTGANHDHDPKTPVGF